MNPLQELKQDGIEADKQKDAWHAKHELLGELLERQQGLLRALEMAKEEALLIKAQERLLDDKFKLLIIGELSRGKSTLLNALLQQDILATSAIPCPVINEIKWAESPKAWLHDGTGTAKEMAVGKLAEVAHAASSAEPYQKVELFWPSELCRDGVALIEYPSLSHLTQSAANGSMSDYFSSVDGVLFVLSCEALFSSSEAQAIEDNLLPAGHEDIFFVCNRFDAIRPKQREQIRQHALSQLQPYTHSDKRIFFVSAVEALEGYLHDEPQRIETSGFPQLEAALTSFLANDRQRVKMQRVIRQSKTIISNAQHLIEEKQAQETQTHSGAQKQARSLTIALRRLSESRSIIVTQIASFSRITQELIRDRITNFWYEIVNSGQVDKWMATYPMGKGRQVTSAFSPDEANKLAAKLIEIVQNQAEQEWSSWQTTQLIPLMNERAEGLTEQLDAEIQTLNQQLNEEGLDISQYQAMSQIDIDLSHFGTPPPDGQLSNLPPLKTRDLLDVGRILFTTVAGGGVLKLVGLNLGVVIPVSIGVVLFRGNQVTATTVAEIKKEVGKLCSEAILENSPQQARQVASAVGERLDQLQQAYDQRMEQRIKEVESQGQSVLAMEEKQQEAIRQRIKELTETDQALQTIEQELTALNAQFDQ